MASAFAELLGVEFKRGEAVARVLGDFVEEMKASGFVAEALYRHGIEGASVPAASNI